MQCHKGFEHCWCRYCRISLFGMELHSGSTNLAAWKMDHDRCISHQTYGYFGFTPSHPGCFGTTRMTWNIFRIGHPNLNFHLPLGILDGGEWIHWMFHCHVRWSEGKKPSLKVTASSPLKDRSKQSPKRERIISEKKGHFPGALAVTPRKTSIFEPENHPFEREKHLNQTFIFGFHVKFWGCIPSWSFRR